MSLIQVILPELILTAVACALFLLGVMDRPVARRASALVALIALLVVFVLQVWSVMFEDVNRPMVDAYGAFRVFGFAAYVKMLSAAVGAMLVLLAWPTDRQATGNPALSFGSDGGEFFALMLLSIAGVFVVAGANDLILLFLGIELASIPTYIMVSISRPLPAAQEAGVKYFFLGAMSAGIMLFGFSYLYGTTGITNLNQIADRFGATLVGAEGAGAVRFTAWQTLAVVMLVAGFAFKMAAVPLHFYAGDVYQGAATPVTAFLSFVPKASGLVALLKILFATGGGVWALPETIVRLIWAIAVLTMTVGNVLGLLQQNVKRLFAYSSIAHSGYMLVGVATLLGATSPDDQPVALQAVLFYLAAYGVMNAAAFGVLMLLPPKPRPAWDRRPSTGSAETFEDIAGAGIQHVGLGLAMAVACFSLIGIPLTVGFFGKFYLIQAAWRGGSTWLVILMMINAAISAGYYLRIVATMFLRPEPVGGIDGSIEERPVLPRYRPLPILTCVVVSSAATLLLGTVWPATEALHTRASAGTMIDQRIPGDVMSEAPLGG
jgi:NADH-quinone oxidoreductase subunit N